MRWRKKSSRTLSSTAAAVLLAIWNLEGDGDPHSLSPNGRGNSWSCEVFLCVGILMDETLSWMGLKYVEPCWTYIYHNNKLNVGKYTIHGAFIRERFINHHKWLGQTTFVLQIPQEVHSCPAESPGLELIRAPKGLDDSWCFNSYILKEKQLNLVAVLNWHPFFWSIGRSDSFSRFSVESKTEILLTTRSCPLMICRPRRHCSKHFCSPSPHYITQTVLHWESLSTWLDSQPRRFVHVLVFCRVLLGLVP